MSTGFTFLTNRIRIPNKQKKDDDKYSTLDNTYYISYSDQVIYMTNEEYKNYISKLVIPVDYKINHNKFDYLKYLKYKSKYLKIKNTNKNFKLNI